MAAVVCGDPMTVKEVNLEELIKRLRELVAGIGLLEEVRPGTRESSMLTSKDWTRIRGMYDLLVAMEERVTTLKSRVQPFVSTDIVRVHRADILTLLERA
jgi:hypothetical protein